MPEPDHLSIHALNTLCQTSKTLRTEAQHVDEPTPYPLHHRESLIPYSIKTVNDNTTHSHSRNCEIPSITTRRRVNNRQLINLHVDIPPFTNSTFSPSVSGGKGRKTPGSDSACSTPMSGARKALSPALMTLQSSNPVTPIEQCSNGLPVLPEAPRMIDVHRNISGRWVPTPTEGVVPALSYAVINSPTTTSEETDCSLMDSESSMSCTTKGHQRRSKVSSRRGSWLSYPKRFEHLKGEDYSDTLASPFVTSHPMTFHNRCSPESTSYVHTHNG